MPSFIIEDLLRLLHFSDLDDKLLDALQINKSYLHLGGASNLSRDQRTTMLTDSLEKWSSETTLDEAQTQLAFIIGSVLFPLIDEGMPFTAKDQTGQDKIQILTDEAISYDVWLMKMIFNAEPAIDDLPPDSELKDVKEEDLEELFHLIRQRNLIRTHTIRPEFSEVEIWMEDLLTYHKILAHENKRYASIYVKPDSGASGAELLAFYNASNEIIRLARSAQIGLSEEPIDLGQARKTSIKESAYAKILGACCEEIDQLNKLLTGEFNQADFLKKIN